MKTITQLGALLALCAVALGAFGAHALKARLGSIWMPTYQTAAEYHITHALAILLLAALSGKSLPERWAVRIAWLFATGILLFSGSLYALSVTQVRVLGAITPLGGACFLLGWALIAWFCSTEQPREN